MVFLFSKKKTSLGFKPLNKQYFLSHKLDFGLNSPDKISPEEKKKYIFGVERTLNPDSLMASTKELTETFQFPSGLAREQNQNIFQEVNNAERKKYNDYNVGPKLDGEGGIIKWSIIGKTDQFMRV
jgi:hypothetical protein